MTKLIDCHSHTNNSPDADDSVKAMCEQAIKLGLTAYAITDHCECNRFYSIEHYNGIPNGYDTYDFNIDLEKSLSEITEAKKHYDGKLNLICGIELGQATHDYEVAEKIVSDQRLDFIIGSMHQLPSNDDFAFIDYTKFDIPTLVKAYYDEIYKLCLWGKFDVLGHLTYTLRYIEGNNGIKVNMKPFEEIIRESFKILINNGKGIEINTSGLRQKYGKTFPSIEYVKMFREMGGEVLSIGSDSHRIADLGKGITDGIEIAKLAGFDYVAYFKNRNPIFEKI